MNKRIKELFKQAANKNFPVGVANIHSNELERFAKLIWEEAYQEGFNAGAEDAILKERG